MSTILSLLAVLLTQGPAAGVHSEEIPWGLRCLERHTSFPVASGPGGGFGLRLPSGQWLPWDDGRRKTPEERLDAPDLEDTLAVPYVRSTPRPVEEPAEDPGRARVTALLEALYGRRGSRLPLVSVPLGAGSVRVHERVAPGLRRVAEKLRALSARQPSVAAALRKPAGGFADRRIAGTDRVSAHAFGIAVDIDTRVSDYWRWAKPGARWRNRVPPEVVEAFESEGFIWGGRWFHFDTMHFEYRPELLDPACAPPPP
jgi:hypothetical protein